MVIDATVLFFFFITVKNKQKTDSISTPFFSLNYQFHLEMSISDCMSYLSFTQISSIYAIINEIFDCQIQISAGKSAFY